MKKHYVKEAICPACKEPLDGATAIDGVEAKPRPDDLTVCLYCTSFLTYQTDMQLRLLTEQEIGDLDCDNRSELMRARKFLQKKPHRGFRK